MTTLSPEKKKLFTLIHDTGLTLEEIKSLGEDFLTTDPHFYLPLDHSYMIESKEQQGSEDVRYNT